MRKNSCDDSSQSSQNSSHSLVQTITSDASLERRFSSTDLEIDQNKTHSISHKVKDKGIYLWFR